MNTNEYVITDTQKQALQAYITNNDRTGFYVALHNMAGSQSALDMAEISSSSGLRGGGAWAAPEIMETDPPLPIFLAQANGRFRRGKSQTCAPAIGLLEPEDLRILISPWAPASDESGCQDF